MNDQKLRFQRSIIYNFAFPWNGWDQAVFSILVMIVFMICVKVVAPDLFFVLSIGAWIGVISNSILTAPAEVQILPQKKASIVEKLDKSGYYYDNLSKSWVSPLPKWLQWRHSRIEFHIDKDNNIFMKGPRIILSQMIRFTK